MTPPSSYKEVKAVNIAAHKSIGGVSHTQGSGHTHTGVRVTHGVCDTRGARQTHRVHVTHTGCVSHTHGDCVWSHTHTHTHTYTHEGVITHRRVWSHTHTPTPRVWLHTGGCGLQISH